MKNTVVKLLTILLILLNGQYLFSQISEGGVPISFTQTNQPSSNIISNFVKAPSNKRLKAEYINPKPSKNDPLTFAYPIYVEYSIDTDGQWLNDGNGGQYWTMAIKSPGSLSLNLLFNKFLLPKSGKLFAYNADKTSLLGAFTDQNNRPDSIFAIAPIEGDEIILEYSQSKDELEKPILSINQVNHDFLGIFKSINTKSIFGFNTSGSCNINVQSDPNYSSCPQMRSECKIVIGGTELCSGTLLTTTQNDSTIYFLTAGHCISTQLKASNTIFYYNYESPHGLKALNGSVDLQTSGATLVASSTMADFALLKLSGERPTAIFRPYLAGWNRSTTPPAPSFAIHHPSGDVKKISKTITPLVATSFNGPTFYYNYHWQVNNWDTGTTEGGSSGCGLFDNGGALVGSLSGGDAVCGNTMSDYFVRFNKIWDSQPMSNEQLAIWLDPTNISTTNSTISGQELYGTLNPKRISNITLLDSGIVKTSTPMKYRSGLYNSSPNSKVAEKFTLTSAKSIEGVYVAVGKGVTSSNHTITLSLYSGLNGPDTLLYSTTATPISTLGIDKEKFIKLGQSIPVNPGNLYVSYSINSVAAGDTVACYYSNIHKDGTPRTLNTAYFYNGVSWIPYSTLYPSENGSFWIDIVTTDQVNTSLRNNMNPSFAIDVFPNPAKDRINIVSSIDDLKIKTVKLVTIDGTDIAIPILSNISNGVSFAVPNNLKGIYLLQIIVNNESITKKIMIQ